MQTVVHGISPTPPGRWLFIAVDILPDPRIREQLSAHSGWPTIPQLFVGGELVGGCDIVEELAAQGQLDGILKGAEG